MATFLTGYFVVEVLIMLRYVQWLSAKSVKATA
jgi:hypothetical protein